MTSLEYQKREQSETNSPNAALALVRPGQAREDRIYAVKNRIHYSLMEHLDLTLLQSLDETARAKEIRSALDHLLAVEAEPLNLAEKVRVIKEMECEILGLGPLESLLEDPAISDILVNRHDQV